MKLNRNLAIGAVVASFGLSGCATPPRFDWNGYDSALYKYSKHPTEVAEFEQALKGTIASGRASGRLAPGLQAELGYLYLGEGKRAEAIEQFNAEMAAFPESRPLMTKIIAQNAG